MVDLNNSAKDKINKELRKAGIRILRESQRRCPVDTGRLRSSLTVQNERMSNGLDRVLVGTNVEYAPFVEFGTVKQAAQPFLRPAIDAVFSQNFNIKIQDFDEDNAV